MCMHIPQQLHRVGSCVPPGVYAKVGGTMHFDRDCLLRMVDPGFHLMVQGPAVEQLKNNKSIKDSRALCKPMSMSVCYGGSAV
jgi:hypothetical protein